MDTLNTPTNFLPAFVHEMQERHARHKDTAIFLLVDGARLLQQSQKQERRTFKLDPKDGISLVVDSSDHNAHPVGPLLFQLDWDDWNTSSRAKTLDGLFKNDVCSIVISPSSITELGQHLRHYMQVMLADGTDMLMRFFDPRILPFWFDDLQLSYRAHIARDIVEWGVFNHRKQLCWLPMELSKTEMSKVTEPDFPRELTAKQEELLMRQCLPYTLLDRLLKSGAHFVAKIEQSKRYEFVDSLIKKAHGYDYDGMANLENFCLMGLQYGLEFDRFMPMRTLLAKPDKPKQVHELMALMTDRDWKDMEAGLLLDGWGARNVKF